MNSSVRDHIADHLPLGAERRDESRDHDEPGVGHEPRDLADPADVLDAVGLGESQILVQTVANVVAVEQERVPIHAVQLLLDQIGDRRFTGAGEACEPEHRRLLTLEAGPRLAADIERLPVDVLAAAQ